MQLNFTPFPTIITERLVLRKLNENDVVPLSILRSNAEVNRYIDRQKQTTTEEAATFINNILKRIDDNQTMYWAITLKQSDVLIGTICLWNIVAAQELAEIGYELHPDFHNKGLMTEAVSAVTEWGGGTIGFKTIVALLDEENVKSVKVLLKNNFKLASDNAELPVRDLDGVVYYLRSL